MRGSAPFTGLQGSIIIDIRRAGVVAGPLLLLARLVSVTRDLDDCVFALIAFVRSVFVT